MEVIYQRDDSVEQDVPLIANNCRVPFIDSQWDEVASIPVPHFSYIISLLLPERLVSLKHDEKERQYFQNILDSQPKVNYDLVKYLGAGSFFEGYSIPKSVKKTVPARLELHSDIDIVLSLSRYVYTLELLKGTPDGEEMNCAALLDRRHTPPGYSRLLVADKKVGWKIDHDERILGLDNELPTLQYISSSVCIDSILEYLASSRAQNSEDLHEDVKIKVHGPAILHEIQEPDKFKPGGYITDIYQQDQVPALRVPVWPLDIADGLLRRAKASKWLDYNVAESIIIEDGCHVVPTPHKKSKCPQLEWRLSFSTSEVRMAAELVTDNQRQCYIYLKILRKQKLKDLETLSSYHCKTVFLYACEDLPVEVWKDSPGGCVLYLLNSLIHCVQQRFLPSYFVPERNMLDHLSEDEFSEIEVILRETRKDPIGPVLDFMDGRVFGLQCADVSFRQIIAPVLKDFDRFSAHRCLQTSVLDIFSYTSFQLAQLLISEGKRVQTAEDMDSKEDRLKIAEGVSYLMDIYPTIRKHHPTELKLSHFLDSVGLNLPETELSVKFYEEALVFVEQYPSDHAIMRTNLACMYHSEAHKYSTDSTERNENLERARVMFQQLVEEDVREAYIDYALFLFDQGNFRKVKEITKKFILLDLPEKSRSIHANSYGHLEIDLLDEDLRREVEMHKELKASSLSFAYYFLIKSMINAKESDAEILQMLVQFDTYAQEEMVATTNALLGYCYIKMQSWEEATIAFRRAIDVRSEYKLAQENLAFCCEKNVHNGQTMS